MTPWEWSMVAVVLGPILAVIAMWFLTQEQAQMASAVLFIFTGAAGVLACGYGIVAIAPFLLPTDLFFAMTATFDKFSAMFYFPFAIIVAAIGMHWYAQRLTTPRTTLQVTGAALVVIGVTWALLSTNILGLVATLFAILCGEMCLTPGTVRYVVLRSVGVIAIATGLFILSSGALFNDFSTLAYIAAELDSARLVAAFSALLLGTTVLSGGWPFSRTISQYTSTMPAKAERALIRSVYVIVPLYLFIRAILFILPPLTLWFAVSVSAIGVLTILSTTRFASMRRAFADTTFVFGAGVAMFMLSSAMTFQALAMFEAMNVTLFATLLHIAGVVLSGATEEYAPNTGTVERTAVNLALLALPPSLCFVSIWMFVSSVVVYQGVLPRPLAVWFVLGTLLLFGAFVRRGYAAIIHLRSVMAQADRNAPVAHNNSFILLACISTLGALFVPFILFSIGAGPLTLGAEGWLGAVVAGDGILSLSALLVGIVGLSAGFWLLRDKTSVALTYDAVEMSVPVEFAETRMTVLRREMYKMAVQYVTTPGLEKIRKFQTWHEAHAAMPVSPAIAFMLLTVILTLAIAL